ncbi:MAG: NAD(P)-dependent oxidoreductase [Nitrospira sp.]
MQPLSVLIVGVGGLGKCMVQEALERGLRVSVLVRDRAKLEAELAEEILARLSKTKVGDGTHAKVLDEAMPGSDVVLSGRGADLDLARELAAAVKRNDIKKLCWPGGTTNVMADDGVTPNYKRLMHLGSWVEGAYRAHGACIDAILQADINHVIFCPGRMDSVGRRSPDVRRSVRINRDAGPFVSYEDAAWVMLEAAITTTYDRQLISAATEL